jgi:hypothetical protein
VTGTITGSGTDMGGLVGMNDQENRDTDLP